MFSAFQQKFIHDTTANYCIQFPLGQLFQQNLFFQFCSKVLFFFFLIVTNRDKKFVNFFLIRTNRKTKSCKTDCNNRYCNLKKAFNQHDFSNIKFFLFCYFTSFHSTTLEACLCLEKVSHTDLLFFELKNPAKSIT